MADEKKPAWWQDPKFILTIVVAVGGWVYTAYKNHDDNNRKTWERNVAIDSAIEQAKQAVTWTRQNGWKVKLLDSMGRTRHPEYYQRRTLR